jgi:hypothetical protein
VKKILSSQIFDREKETRKKKKKKEPRTSLFVGWGESSF